MTTNASLLITAVEENSHKMSRPALVRLWTIAFENVTTGRTAEIRNTWLIIRDLTAREIDNRCAECGLALNGESTAADGVTFTHYECD